LRYRRSRLTNSNTSWFRLANEFASFSLLLTLTDEGAKEQLGYDCSTSLRRGFLFFQKNLLEGGDRYPLFFSSLVKGLVKSLKNIRPKAPVNPRNCTLKTEYNLKTSPCLSHCSEVLRAEDKPRATMTWEIKGTPVRLGHTPRDGWPTRMGRG